MTTTTIAVLVNLTPHTLNIKKSDGEFLVLPPSGRVARVPTAGRNPVGSVNGIEVSKSTMGAVEVPSLADGEIGIVSLAAKVAILQTAPQMSGVILSPGPLIRGADGQPVGCDGLEA